MSDAYKNLTKSELVEADHYAETGNSEGLRKMQRVSSEREHQRVEQPWERMARLNGGTNE